MELDLAKADGSADGSVATLAFPCRLHEATPDGKALQSTGGMQHLLVAAEESPFGHGAQTVKDPKVRQSSAHLC